MSLLLPGSGTADQWLDFLQSQRQFWPAMTTRHASLAPINIHTFQRERRHMQSKHLWDSINITWQALSKKLYVSKPTGLTRAELWELLFVTKHRANPWQEREYQGAYRDEVWDSGIKRSATWMPTRPLRAHSAVILVWPLGASTLTMLLPLRRLRLPRLACPSMANERRHVPDQGTASSGCQGYWRCCYGRYVRGSTLTHSSMGIATPWMMDLDMAMLGRLRAGDGFLWEFDI